MDEAWLRTINAWSLSPTIAGVGLALSASWVLWVVLLPLAGWLLLKRRYAAIASIFLACGLADTVNSRLVKPLVGRERPCRALQGLIQPAGCGPGRSFASGHATLAAALAVSAGPTVPGGMIILPALAVLVSASRVLLGVHYPSDLLGGWVLGGAIGVGATLGRRAAEKRSQRVAEASRSQGPVVVPGVVE